MRILVATVTAGSGHIQAAAALEEAWKMAWPDDNVKRVDLLDLVPKLQRKVYAEGYVKLVEHAPELYELFFNKTRQPPATSGTRDPATPLAPKAVSTSSGSCASASRICSS